MAPSIFTARDIVSSHAAVDGSVLVRDLVEWFKQHPAIDFAAVFDQGEIKGLAGREALNARIAGSKYGFSVLADKPVAKIVIENPMIVEASLPVSDLVRQLLEKRGGLPMAPNAPLSPLSLPYAPAAATANAPHASVSFYDDIVVHDQGRFLGLASVKQLVVKQMEYILDQMRSLERQQSALAQKNKELFEASLRINKSNSQFKSFFENCSIPIVVFDEYGMFIQANPRFQRLAGYVGPQLLSQPNDVLFEGGISEMLTSLGELQEELGDRKPTWCLNLIQSNGNRQGVEVSYEYDETSRQIIISILRLTDEADMRVARMLQDRAAHEGSSLFRSVAANLIDRETDEATAMKKLDALISYAAKIEAGASGSMRDSHPLVGGNAIGADMQDPTGLSMSATGTGRLRLGAGGLGQTRSNAASSQNLHGSLGQLSIVDMTQLLVQGRKTGELTITDNRGNTGVVYIRQGFICHAITGGLKGAAALHDIMRVESGSFLFAYDVLPSETTIHGHDPMGILMDAVSDVDEQHNGRMGNRAEPQAAELRSAV